MSGPDNHVYVLFGATGDLAKRKLLPGLFQLSIRGLLPPRFRIVGTARSARTDEQFREHARDAVAEFGASKPSGDAWDAFASTLSFGRASPGDTAPLEAAVQRATDQVGGAPRRLLHLAIPPTAFEPTVGMLVAAGLAQGARIIVEKPFGTDLRSAQDLDRELHTAFDELQIFRIDHFLGKEAVDNILAFRFANGLFEPIWNRDHISYVQIDVPEALSIEGRADFYDGTGAYRDMIVTHLFQVLGFVAMEPPTTLDAKHLLDERAKVFDAVKPLDVRHVVRGQYDGYLDELGVPPDSTTETMAAVRVEIDNWRWAGVPFFLRSGKRLGASRQLITLGLRRPTLRMFHTSNRQGPTDRGNEIVIDFADPGSISTGFLAKQPGLEMILGAATMQFRYEDSFCTANDLEGYERLIVEAMLGDQTLFTRDDGVERLWEISSPLLDNPPAVETYRPGSWGPEPSLTRLIAPHRWHLATT